MSKRPRALSPEPALKAPPRRESRVSHGKNLLLGVPKAVLHHALAFATLMDLAGVYAASRALALQIPAYLAAAATVHTGFLAPEQRGRDRKLLPPPFASAHPAMLGMLCVCARSIVELRMDDAAEAADSGSVLETTAQWASRLARLIRRCSRTLRVADLPGACYSLDVQRALVQCSRLRVATVSAMAETEALIPIIRELTRNCRSVDTITSRGAYADTYAAVHRELLENLVPRRIKTVALYGLGGASAFLGRFAATASLAISSFNDRDPAVLADFEGALLQLGSLARLSLGLSSYAGFADGRVLRLPPSLTALDLESKTNDSSSMRIDAPGLLHFTSPQYQQRALALVVRGAPLLQSIRCAQLDAGDRQWSALVDAFGDPGDAAARKQLRTLVVERCDSEPTGATLLRLAERNPGLETLCVQAQDVSGDQVLAILAACPSMTALNAQLYGAMSRMELRLVSNGDDHRLIGGGDETQLVGGGDDHSARLETPRAALPLGTGVWRLRELGLGECSFGLLRTLARLGLTARVTRLAGDGFRAASAEDAVDLFVILEAFPAAEDCSIRLGFAPQPKQWRTPSRSSRVTALALTFARGDSSGTIGLVAAWCPSVRTLTLVGPDLECRVLERLAAHPTWFAHLVLVRFCGRASLGLIGASAALAESRPRLALQHCLHTRVFSASVDVRCECDWHAV